MRVRSGRNGISFRFGQEQFTYKSRETGELRGEELIVWFNVENPSVISVTNLKEDPRTLFTVEREIRVPGMDAPPEVLSAALAQNEAHEEYRKALYRAVSQNFSTGFAGRMFRQNLIDHKVAELGNAMREQHAAIRRQRLKKETRSSDRSEGRSTGDRSWSDEPSSRCGRGHRRNDHCNAKSRPSDSEDRPGTEEEQ